MQNRTTSALVCKHILQEIIKGQGPYSLQGPCLCLPVSRPAGLLRARVPCLQPTMPTLTSTTWTHLPRYPTPLTPILPCASPPPPWAWPAPNLSIYTTCPSVHPLATCLHPNPFTLSLTHTLTHYPPLLFCVLPRRLWLLAQFCTGKRRNFPDLPSALTAL